MEYKVSNRIEVMSKDVRNPTFRVVKMRLEITSALALASGNEIMIVGGR